MRLAHSSRLLAFVLFLMMGLLSLPISPAAAANCSAIGPGANLAGCDLSGLDLSGVNLAGANLRGANLEGANLDGANLSGANLSNARITEGALDTANTSGANLRGIRWVAAQHVIATVGAFNGAVCPVTITLVNGQPGSPVGVTIGNSNGTWFAPLFNPPGFVQDTGGLYPGLSMVSGTAEVLDGNFDPTGVFLPVSFPTTVCNA
jgi:hypothetical protein